ncbi:MAG: helix-turn-helix transcriptional regulator [Cytophagaceae bacterium]|nr:helix-turn-helix transcriptional regulator [Cytophagaceae bacterium]
MDVIIKEVSYTELFKVIGAKWSSGIILEINKGNQRFAAIQKALPGITKKSLSRELRKLEEFRLIVRHVERDTVQHIHYTLTPPGEQLIPIINGIQKWIEDNYHHQ